MIKKELTKYKKLFRDIDEDRRQLVEKLYNQAAFMYATLAELQDIINRDGAVIKSTNGNGFETTMEHPAQKSYNTMIRNYTGVMSRLMDLLPEGDAEADELLEFIGRGKK